MVVGLIAVLVVVLIRLSKVEETVYGTTPVQVISAPVKEGTDASHYEDKIALNWGHLVTNVASAREKFGVTGEGVKVAIISTGIDVNHEVFEAREIKARSFIPSGEPDSKIHDSDGDGTFLAGLITSIAPNCQLYIAKALRNDGVTSNGQDPWILPAIEWAIEEECDIILLPLGTNLPDGEYPQSYQTLAQHALSRGCLVVGSAGNMSDRLNASIASVSRPANCPSIVAVTSVDRKLAVSNFAPRGTDASPIHLAAPGEKILSIAPDDQMELRTGTNVSAAYVAGILALVKEGSPNKSGLDLYNSVRNSAQKPNAKEDYGHGLVDAKAALEQE